MCYVFHQQLPNNINFRYSDNDYYEIEYSAKSYVQPVEEDLLKKLTGNRIFDPAYFIPKILEVQQHKQTCPNGGTMAFNKETKVGLESTFIFKCKDCWAVKKISNVPKKSENSMSLNEAAVWGISAIGSGHSHLEEVSAVLNLGVISHPTFTKLEAKLGTVWESVLHQCMIEAGKEERLLAIEAGDLDNDGTPFISVIVDGGWSQRCYGHKYNALSGVGCIIGSKTKKLLFFGVRNKYCCICAMHKDGEEKEHVCFKNWSGTSCAMEPDIIVEGFNESERMHGLRYKRLIGDGDSSVQKKIIENVSYGREVEKVECANHCVKNYTKALHKISGSSTDCRKILSKPRIKRLTAAARGAVKNVKQIPHRQEAVKTLTDDLKNGPAHVFGNHSKCTNQYCKSVGDTQNDIFSTMPTQVRFQIMSAVNSLLRKAPSLIYDETSNAAENYMQIVSKFTGGKRVNRSKKCSYNVRCSGAGLAYQMGSGWHMTAMKLAHGKSPNVVVKQMSIRRMKSQARQKKNKSRIEAKTRRKLARRNAPQSSETIGDPDYGPNAQKPDMEKHLYKEEAAAFLTTLEVTAEKQAEIEKNTRGQSENPLWQQHRRNRLTASIFGEVCKMKETTSCKAKVKRILYSTDVCTEAMQYGRDNEKIALEEYTCSTGIDVTECGLVVDLRDGFLAASPDGFIGVDGLIEIKCPKTAKELTPHQASKNIKGFYCKEDDSGQLRLKKTHGYYYQIQGQLAITQREFCDFVVWTPLGHSTERILRNDSFWEEEMRPKLTRFYMQCILPELIDSRVNRNMDVRDPQYILQAQQQAQLQKQKTQQEKEEKRHAQEQRQQARQQSDGRKTKRAALAMPLTSTPAKKKKVQRRKLL